MSNKHPILGRGELYVKDIEKRYYGGPQKLPIFIKWGLTSTIKFKET